jgi:hypothetical protein
MVLLVRRKALLASLDAPRCGPPLASRLRAPKQDAPFFPIAITPSRSRRSTEAGWPKSSDLGSRFDGDATPSD